MQRVGLTPKTEHTACGVLTVATYRDSDENVFCPLITEGVWVPQVCFSCPSVFFLSVNRRVDSSDKQEGIRLPNGVKTIYLTQRVCFRVEICPKSPVFFYILKNCFSSNLIRTILNLRPACEL